MLREEEEGWDGSRGWCTCGLEVCGAIDGLALIAAKAVVFATASERWSLEVMCCVSFEKGMLA